MLTIKILAEVTVKELVISKTSSMNQVVKNKIGAWVNSPDNIENEVSLCIIIDLSSGCLQSTFHLPIFIFTPLLS
jgi:hypothetical protein